MQYRLFATCLAPACNTNSGAEFDLLRLVRDADAGGAGRSSRQGAAGRRSSRQEEQAGRQGVAALAAAVPSL